GDRLWRRCEVMKVGTRLRRDGGCKADDEETGDGSDAHVGSRWKNREEVTRRRARPTAASGYAGEGATSSAVCTTTPLLRRRTGSGGNMISSRRNAEICAKSLREASAKAADAAAISWAPALCCSVEAATCSMAAANDSVPRARCSSRMVDSATSSRDWFAACSIACVQPSVCATARSTSVNDESARSV